MWEELSVEVDQLPPTRSQAGQLHSGGRRDHLQVTQDARQQVGRRIFFWSFYNLSDRVYQKLNFIVCACRWSKIAARLPGRTDNEIKNVWNTHLKKRLRSSSSVEEEGKAEEPQSSSSASSALNQPGQQEATAEDGSSWWVVEYLEKELGLSDEIQNNQVSGAAEAAGLMQEDPVSTYFLRELSSSSDLGAPLCFEDAGSVQIH